MKSQLRISIIVFALLDLFLFYRLSRMGWSLLSHFQFALVPFLKLFLIISLLFSGVLLLMDNKAGLILYYFQFPLKLAFMFLTFGFLLYVIPVPNPLIYKVLVGVVIGIETVRLLLTIKAHRG